MEEVCATLRAVFLRGGWEGVPFFLPTDKSGDVMAGTGRTILDHKVNLRKEVMNGLIIRQEKQEL